MIYIWDFKGAYCDQCTSLKDHCADIDAITADFHIN